MWTSSLVKPSNGAARPAKSLSESSTEESWTAGPALSTTLGGSSVSEVWFVPSGSPSSDLRWTSAGAESKLPGLEAFALWCESADSDRWDGLDSSGIDGRFSIVEDDYRFCGSASGVTGGSSGARSSESVASILNGTRNTIKFKNYYTDISGSVSLHQCG